MRRWHVVEKGDWRDYRRQFVVTVGSRRRSRFGIGCFVMARVPDPRPRKGPLPSLLLKVRSEQPIPWPALHGEASSSKSRPPSERLV